MHRDTSYENYCPIPLGEVRLRFSDGTNLCGPLAAPCGTDFAGGRADPKTRASGPPMAGLAGESGRPRQAISSPGRAADGYLQNQLLSSAARKAVRKVASARVLPSSRQFS